MSDWTAADVPDLSGKTVVVTGANSGLGFEATRAFAEKGAHVVMACRSLDRGADAMADIRESVPAASLTLSELDLADLDSVRQFADEFAAEHGSLHVLCNNAGVMAIPRRETAQGFETQFGVNHLGHFALSARLFPTLRDTPGETRLVTMSSGLHERGRMEFDDLQGERDYDEWDAYAQSKLSNLLFAFELDRRLTAAGIDDVLSVGAHPGYAATNLQFRGPEASGSTLRYWMSKLGNAIFAQSAEMGALPLLYAATSPAVESGEYVGPQGLFGMRGTPGIAEPSDRARDPETAARLWDVSEELTDTRFRLA
ncbi:MULTISPECIES: oxidoreductase [Haloferax]|uniref:SDR family NAD(P)-dependent oxidoreductase n=3 Tax=Haloferax volcanii TaxID=2246 RepID=A0A6C0UWS3_HALVO|nr:MULTISPECIES: oxidoreductase [Haloferax]ELK51114.1 short-chain family oxidoreductase [Haloferax sp. BAB-2207]ELZ76821.1 short-chain family oxidoreductase [Haloferax lucentense DSM 14919]ELZ86804.1 short-chain family oxidoreductase [Haloferax alexandrinus JCM 10717]MBC9987272.1 SDR family NAD(P)-dependent oxidoreductase [Haloferax sp. AS1]NLV04202.1 SDR family NAD(P)-dependent oxidoreductase [Haloferax alexandrinus]